jgi:hypothetical protein
VAVLLRGGGAAERSTKNRRRSRTRSRMKRSTSNKKRSWIGRGRRNRIRGWERSRNSRRPSIRKGEEEQTDRVTKRRWTAPRSC